MNVREGCLTDEALINFQTDIFEQQNFLLSCNKETNMSIVLLSVAGRLTHVVNGYGNEYKCVCIHCRSLTLVTSWQNCSVVGYSCYQADDFNSL